MVWFVECKHFILTPEAKRLRFGPGAKSIVITSIINGNFFKLKYGWISISIQISIFELEGSCSESLNFGNLQKKPWNANHFSHLFQSYFSQNTTNIYNISSKSSNYVFLTYRVRFVLVQKLLLKYFCNTKDCWNQTMQYFDWILSGHFVQRETKTLSDKINIIFFKFYFWSVLDTSSQFGVI